MNAETVETATAALTASIDAMDEASGKNSPDFHAALCAHFVALDALTAASAADTATDWSHRAPLENWYEDYSSDFEES
jgi:hypothetical protein